MDILGVNADLKTRGVAMKNRSVPSFGLLSALVLIMLSLSLPVSAQDRGLSVVTQEITGRADFDPGRQYAVVIGIDRYKEWPTLRSAVAEAKAVRKILFDRYFIDEFFELYDAGATAANIRRLFMETLPSRIGPKDSLLVFYAGHGQTDSTKTGFWIASDGSKDIFSQNNWIPNAQLRNMIGNLKAQRILILADACFSGDFLNVSRGASPTIDNAYYRRALQLTARQVLTSGASESVPDESEFGHQLLNLLERNEAPILDPSSMYERIRLGVTQTMPLLGTFTGNEEGASFALFLKAAGTAAGADLAGGGDGGRPASLAPPTGKADLMVKADQPGAEVFVDGVPYGKAPVLVKRLDAGRPLKVVASTDTMSGSAEISLSPGDLKDLSLSLKALVGNLYVASNEAAVNLIIDGADMGSLGPGLFKALSVGVKNLELKGMDLYGTALAKISPDETTEVRIVVRPVGSLSIDAPPDAPIKIEGADWTIERVGGGPVPNVPEGKLMLRAGGSGGYLPATETMNLARGQAIAWKPWKGGRMAFTPGLEGVQCSIDGAPAVEASGGIDGLAPGLRKLLFKKPGYRDGSQAVTLELGRTAEVGVILERLEPALLSFDDFGIDLRLEAEAGTVTGPQGRSGAAMASWSVASGIPVKLAFASPYALSLDIPAIETTFAEGEVRQFAIPAGAIALPWLPEGTGLSIGDGRSRELENSGTEGFTSRLLPPGEYLVKVGSRYAGKVQVAAGSVAEPADYRAAIAQALGSERAGLKLKLAFKGLKTIAGWASLAIGILYTLVAVSDYDLGSQARVAYDAATTTAAAEAAWTDIELHRSAFPFAAAVGGIGLGLSPVLLLGGPSPKALRHSIEALDAGIRALGK